MGYIYDIYRKRKRKKATEIINPKKYTPMEVSTHRLTTPITEELTYIPRSKETKEGYEKFLSSMQKHLGDVTQETLRGAADEAIIILKDDNLTDISRKATIEAVVGVEMNDYDFHTLTILGKSFIDYRPEGTRGEGGEEEIQVNVELDEEEDMEHSDNSEHLYAMVDPGEEEEEEEEGQRIQKKGEESSEGEGEDSGGLRVGDIDAHWLLREVTSITLDETKVLELESRILELLRIKNLRECENKLVEVLEYSNFSFIKSLMKNRVLIYYTTKLNKCVGEGEREDILREMREGGEEERGVMKEYLEWKGGGRGSGRGMEFAKSLKREADRLRQVDRDREGGVGEEELGELIKVTEVDLMGEGAGPRPTPRRVIDLEALKFEEGGHYLGRQKFTLPETARESTSPGYQEIYLPAPPSNISHSERLLPISELPSWAQPAFTSLKPPLTHLNRIQSKIYKSALLDSENLLVCAPTGAGKTNIALLCMLREIGNRIQKGRVETRGLKIIYIAPMKALVQEMVGSFSQRLEEYGLSVRELTGDVHLTKQEIEATQVIFSTPEKWDIITRKSGQREFLTQVSLIIIDEVHLLHDLRGPVLEGIVARTIRQIESTRDLVRIVGLSATLPNYRDVAAFLRVDPKKGLFFFDASYRPVPLEQVYIGITEKKAIKRLMLMNEIVYNKVIERASTHQIIIFVHSRKETSRTARAIRDMALAKDTISKFLQENADSRQIIEQELENVISEDLKQLLPYGLAIHHAGMNRKDRNLVEDLFAHGHILVLISTATLAWGVNLPAHTVIIKGTEIYSPEKGKWIELSPQDILQMMGRAGRPFYDKEGEGILITTHWQLQYYLSLNNMQLPIESQFISQLPDQLNAEIVLGNVRNIREGARWLGYTYLYIRMLREPKQYGVIEMDKGDKTLWEHRMDLIHSAAGILDKASLIKYERGSGMVQVTELGRVSSHFYIKHDSMSVYNENLKRNMGILELIRLFSLSKEFQYIPIREEEKNELVSLGSQVPIPIKGSLEETTSKISILLQAYISKFKMEGFALNSDMVYVTQSAGRLFRALFEITLKRGWAPVAAECLKISKMVDRRMWSVSIPLRQFKGIPDEIFRKLEQKEQFSWQHYYDMTPQQIGDIIKYHKMGKTIHSLIQTFPRVELEVYLQPITKSSARIELTVRPVFTWDDKIHGAGEPFWVFVEDADQEQILHSEQITIKKKYSTEEHILSFIVPIYEPMPPQYFVRVVSDRWIHSESLLPISFRHLILPDRFPPPRELLDMQPIPLTALKSKLAQALYPSFTEFNAIQTQTFKTVYESDENVLVGASTGSGKTVIAELAILRQIDMRDEGKWVYITPIQRIFNFMYPYLKGRFEDLLGIPTVKLTGQTSQDLKALQIGQLIVTTPEHWDMISRRWKQRKNVQKVSLFIVDELHLFSETKGALEIIISRTRYMCTQLSSNIRILGLSSSIANSTDISEWLGVTPENVFNFHPNVRPTPLEIHIQGFDYTNRGSRLFAMGKPTYSAILQYGKGREVMLFTGDRSQAMMSALSLQKHTSGDANPRRFLTISCGAGGLDGFQGKLPSQQLIHQLLLPSLGKEIQLEVEYLEQELSTVMGDARLKKEGGYDEKKGEIKGKLVEVYFRGLCSYYEAKMLEVGEKALEHTLTFGVGYLHEGLGEADKQIVLDLYRLRIIQVIVLTAPMAWELQHTFCYLGIVIDPVKYEGSEHRYLDFPISDMLQMMGRATLAPTPQNPSTPKFIIFCHTPRKELFKKFLYESLPVESQLDHFLQDHLNAEIVSQSIETKGEALDWLTWTFYYRRLCKNPNYYNLEGSSGEHLNDHLSELIELSLEELETAGCIEIEQDNLTPGNLGRIAAYYYTTYSTIQAFRDGVDANLNMRGLIAILSAAQEFSDVYIYIFYDIIYIIFLDNNQTR